jgi:tetratricopeptide (TPR) repeat protein
MSFTDNPSDTTFLVVIAICWFALAAPPIEATARLWSPSWRTAGIGLAALLVLAAIGSTFAAAIAFDASQASASAGDKGSTVDRLATAVALDPGQALYWRERGMHRAASGDSIGAIDDLRVALRLNPGDTPAMRALALLLAGIGDDSGALAVARRAAELRPTHDGNLTTLALVASRVGDDAASREALVEALRRTPWIAASPRWQGTFPTGSELQALIASADEAWVGRTDGDRYAMAQVWLAAANGGGGRGSLGGRGWAIPSLLAADALLHCDLDAAKEAIDGPLSRSADGQSLLVAVLVGRASGSSSLTETATALADLRNTGFFRLINDEPDPTSPFWEPDEDRRLYERNPVVPADLGVQLPTAAEGLSAWLRDPGAAASVGAPGSGLAACSGGG